MTETAETQTTSKRLELLTEALDRGGDDALTLVQNETSTGVINALDEIAAVMRDRPDVLFLVDAREGLNAADEALARHLRQRNKALHLVVN